MMFGVRGIRMVVTLALLGIIRMLPTQLLGEDSWSNTQKDKIGAVFLDAAENPKTFHLPKHEYPHFEAPIKLNNAAPTCQRAQRPVTFKKCSTNTLHEDS